VAWSCDVIEKKLENSKSLDALLPWMPSTFLKSARHGLWVLHIVVKKSLESDYPRPKAGALCHIHGFATAISKAFFRQSQITLTPPRGRGFKSLNKLLILSHREKHYRVMGRFVAEGNKLPIKELLSLYGTYLMEALRLKPTIKKNVNVLLHMIEYFKTTLSADEKRNSSKSRIW
jgi:hypothetical protein